MRVLHVTRTYLPDTHGGIEEAIRQICLTTKEYGIDSTVFTLTKSENVSDITLDGIRVIRSQSIFSISNCDFGGIDTIKKFLIAAAENDVVHYHFPWPFFDILDLFLPKDKIRLMTYHSDIMRQRFLSYIYKPLMKYTFRKMNVIISTSPNYAKTSQNLQGDVKTKTQIIPLGCSLHNFSDSPKIADSVKQISRERYILFIGSLRYYKGLNFLFDAAPHIKSNIIIAGSGGIETELHKALLDNSLTNIYMTGHINDDEKWYLLKNCSVFVLPSHLRAEAFGMCLLEACIMAKPLVTCEIGSGTSFVNIDGVTGRVVPPANVKALSDAINELLDNKIKAEQMGFAAFERYIKHFSSNILGSNYYYMYANLINKNS